MKLFYKEGFQIRISRFLFKKLSLRYKLSCVNLQILLLEKVFLNKFN